MTNDQDARLVRLFDGQDLGQIFYEYHPLICERPLYCIGIVSQILLHVVYPSCTPADQKGYSVCQVKSLFLQSLTPGTRHVISNELACCDTINNNIFLISFISSSMSILFFMKRNSERGTANYPFIHVIAIGYINIMLNHIFVLYVI